MRCVPFVSAPDGNGGHAVQKVYAHANMHTHFLQSGIVLFQLLCNYLFCLAAVLVMSPHQHLLMFPDSVHSASDYYPIPWLYHSVLAIPLSMGISASSRHLPPLG